MVVPFHHHTPQMLHPTTIICFMMRKRCPLLLLLFPSTSALFTFQHFGQAIHKVLWYHA